MPVNDRLFEGEVLLGLGPGPKLQAAERGDLVAFEVDELPQALRSGHLIGVRRRRAPGVEVREQPGQQVHGVAHVGARRHRGHSAGCSRGAGA